MWKVRGLRWILAVALCAFAPAAAFGQSGETDAGEVAAYGGGSFGLGTHPFVGGSSGFAFSRYGMAFVDASYMPSGHDMLWPRSDMKSPQDGRLFDFNASFHVRIPVRNRLAPYGILGAGLLWDSFRAISGPEGALIRINDFKFGFHTGAGLRYYLGESWGIRPEFRVIVSSRTFTRLSMGVFYTLPPNWP